MSQTAQSQRDLHPFGGCNRLLGHYQCIGSQLLSIEFRGGIGSFREGVAFVPVEVLESYLEDLLDRAVREETLYIKREFEWYRSRHMLGLGFIGAVGVAMYAASSGASLPVAFGIAAVLGGPLGILMYSAPKIGLVRRMSFAQILSGEISRRRGRGKEGDLGSRSIIRDVLSGPSRSPIQGAAKQLYH